MRHFLRQIGVPVCEEAPLPRRSFFSSLAPDFPLLSLSQVLRKSFFSPACSNLLVTVFGSAAQQERGETKEREKKGRWVFVDNQAKEEGRPLFPTQKDPGGS